MSSEPTPNTNVLADDAVAGAVLVVDDDGEIRSLVAKFLREHGFRVHTARNGVEMTATIASVAIDLIILDLMLPGTNGLDLCRALRKTSAIPVIMLTARGDEIDRIVGLEVGADDYLPKPFNPRELLARVNAVLRRYRALGSVGGERPARLLRFAGWTLDVLRRELVDPEGVAVDLSTGEYDLLLVFVEAPQRVLTRDFLLDAARNRVSDHFDRTIDVQISRLRRKVEKHGEMIKTIRGAGYMFIPDVVRG